MKKLYLSFAIFLTSISVNMWGQDTHDYVDLGLPSGLMWATCNVGANSPEEFGEYFAWGETVPKKEYSWSTYKHCNGSNNTLKKYCTSPTFGYLHKILHLENPDDAANANWGGTWRMPTPQDFEELRLTCRFKRTVLKGKNVCQVIGPNGNSIFLPYAGMKSGHELCDAGNGCYYLSSDAHEVVNYYAMRLWIDQEFFVYYNTHAERCLGFSVRPVCEITPVHTAVDMGLPSGKKWASCNLGANRPIDYGWYYAWGSTDRKPTYSNNYQTTDSNVSLKKKDDAAFISWGGDWRIPTKQDWDELFRNCTSQSSIKLNGKKLIMYVGPNGNRIFLPYAEGWYWTSTVAFNYKDQATVIELISEYGSFYTKSSTRSRKLPCAIRPVLYAR